MFVFLFDYVKPDDWLINIAFNIDIVSYNKRNQVIVYLVLDFPYKWNVGCKIMEDESHFLLHCRK